MLFNLGLDLGLKFKRCKYCNRWFLVHHNRQMHCCNQHRIYYFKERQTQKEFDKRMREQHVGYIDNNRDYVTGKPNRLKQLGSLNATLTPHMHKNTSKEMEVVENELKRIGLRTGDAS
jgi:ABC-type Mn2+/Zn2+ transport system ATPase subunit